MAGTWVPPSGTTHFAFLHRFELVGDEVTRLVNYPTLVLTVGLPASFALAATYTSRSELGVGKFNEWEVGARRRFGEGRLRGSAYLAWNSAAESADGELAATARSGRITLQGAVRAFSRPFGESDGGAAAGLGALFTVTPRLALVADVARFLTTDTLPTAWSAGVHMAIPGTPHTLGFVVANQGVTTLQGASRGLEKEDGVQALRYGFAFTLPLGTLRQWGRIFEGRDDDGDEGPTVHIRDFGFTPAEIRITAGESVRWDNDDPVAHSVTAADEAFDSGLIQPGEGYLRRFDTVGRYPYHCTPHPQMRGVVVVVEPG